MGVSESWTDERGLRSVQIVRLEAWSKYVNYA